MNDNLNSIETTPSTANGPTMMLGAGQLCAAVCKEGEELGGWQYRFNIFRMNKLSGAVEQLFQPSDIADLVKLARVLAFAIADDGCLSCELQEELCRLSVRLDDVMSADWHG